MDNIKNNPKKKGQFAHHPQYLGPGDRYSIGTYHTDGDAVEWRIVDTLNLDTKNRAAIVASAPTRGEAISLLSVILNAEAVQNALRILRGMGKDYSVQQTLQLQGFDDEWEYLLTELVIACDVAQQARDHSHAQAGAATK